MSGKRAPLPVVNTSMEKHRLDFFGDDCPLCQRYLRDIELGKCFKVELTVHHTGDPAEADIIRQYRIVLAPTVVLDGRVKIEGRPAATVLDGVDDCRAALGQLLQTAPPLPDSLTVGQTHGAGNHTDEGNGRGDPKGGGASWAGGRAALKAVGP